MQALAHLRLGRYPRIGVRFEPESGGRPDAVFREHAAMMAEAVIGGRWSERAAEWRYPLTVEKCREMREAWGRMLRVERDLSEWFKATAQAQRKQAAIGSQTDAELRVVPTVAPGLYAALGPDQRAGAAWIASLYRCAGIYAPEMGVGKTRGVLAGLVERQVQGKVLIVCPKISVRQVWGREFGQWLPDVPVFLATGNRAKREAALADFEAAEVGPLGFKVLVVVAEMLRVQGERKSRNKMAEVTGYEYPALFPAQAWDAVVLDESQKLLGALTVSKGNLMSEGLRRLPVATHDRAMRLPVTGTPFGRGGREEGLFGSLHWCWPDEYSSFWRWAEENFVVTEKFIGRGKPKVKKIGPLRDGRDGDTFLRSFGPRIFRVTLAEVSPDHAEKLKFVAVPCEMTGTQANEYASFADNGELMLPGGLLAATGTLAMMTRCRQLANGILDKEGDHVIFGYDSGKIDRLFSVLGETGTLEPDGPKAVIASQFNEFLEVVCERLEEQGIPYYLMTGGTTERQREAMMDDFQDPNSKGPRVFVMNGKAGGVSINLDAADYMHVLDEMFPPEANEQLYRRIFRRSRVHRAYVFLYRSTGTIDEKIADDVAVKLQGQLRILDGRRGLRVVRELVQYEGKTT